MKLDDNWKKLCDETYAELIASYGENSNPRVVSWQKSTNSECLLAVYFQNHKIQLIEYFLTILSYNLKIIKIDK